jgi:hypothetical protein
MAVGPDRTIIAPAVSSTMTATTARRVMADRRASEKTELASWIAPRAALRSLASRKRGIARLDMSASNRSTTHISTSVVPIDGRGAETAECMRHHAPDTPRIRHRMPALWRVFPQPSSCTVVSEDLQYMTRRILLGMTIILAASSCTNPRVQANIAQALNDVGNELTAQRQDMALLQDQVDSLKRAMAHQDSTIKRLINVTGIPAVQ